MEREWKDFEDQSSPKCFFLFSSPIKKIIRRQIWYSLLVNNTLQTTIRLAAGREISFISANLNGIGAARRNRTEDFSKKNREP